MLNFSLYENEKCLISNTQELDIIFLKHCLHRYQGCIHSVGRWVQKAYILYIDLSWNVRWTTTLLLIQEICKEFLLGIIRVEYYCNVL